MCANVRRSGIVRKSNALCRARWRKVSIYEARLLALVAARVQPSDSEFALYAISASELMVGQIDGGSAYELVRETCQALMSRVIRVCEDGSRSFTLYHVVDRCAYDDATHMIYIQLHPEMKPHYLGLKQRYTQYLLTEFLALASYYSQRIYEWLKSWQDQTEVEVRLDELHEMLESPASYRANFRTFRRRVLDPAHAEITSRTGLRYEWRSVHAGRRVVALVFTLRGDTQDLVPAWEEQIALARKAAQCYRAHRDACLEDQPGAVCLRCRRRVVTS